MWRASSVSAVWLTPKNALYRSFFAAVFAAVFAHAARQKFPPPACDQGGARLCKTAGFADFSRCLISL
jgi:hypothetical protein